MVAFELVVKLSEFCGDGGKGVFGCGCGGPRAMILLNDVLRFAA